MTENKKKNKFVKHAWSCLLPRLRTASSCVHRPTDVATKETDTCTDCPGCTVPVCWLVSSRLFVAGLPATITTNLSPKQGRSQEGANREVISTPVLVIRRCECIQHKTLGK